MSTDGSRAGPPAPEPGSVEAWALEYVLSASLDHKLAPPAPPGAFEADPAVRRLFAPGRPPELRQARRGLRVPRDLSQPSARAKLLHTFFQHELSAAELMLWAVLAFADAELPFRAGLVRIALDEIRHMNAYRGQIERLGFRLGDFAVRDWFWQRVPTCETKLAFVSLMGMGLEAANLDHAPAFGERLRRAGDHEAAAVQDRIAREELGHVRFGVFWFERWTQAQSFDAWCAALPPPLSPLLMRGKTFDNDARLRAGMSPEFVAALERWRPSSSDPSNRREFRRPDGATASKFPDHGDP
jgi:uncharacterized ferritin-like protein (DUF455 family)